MDITTEVNDIIEEFREDLTTEGGDTTEENDLYESSGQGESEDADQELFNHEIKELYYNTTTTNFISTTQPSTNTVETEETSTEEETLSRSDIIIQRLQSEIKKLKGSLGYEIGGLEES